MLKKIRKLNKFVRKIERMQNSGACPSLIYDRVFALAAKINALMNELGLDTEYWDPDTTYEEDVAAYVSSRREQLDTLLDQPLRNWVE